MKLSREKWMGGIVAGMAVMLLVLGVSGCGGGGGGGGGSPVAVDVSQTFTAVPDEALKQKIEQAIAKIKARQLNSKDNTPWVIMHAIIAFDLDLNVTTVADGAGVNAVTFLCSQATYQNQKIFRSVDGRPSLPTRNLSFGLTESYVVQDHVDQFLFAFSGAGVPLTQTIVADDGASYTVADMVTVAIANFRTSQELAWTMVSLATYNGIDAAFTNNLGNTYTLADLLALAVKLDSSKETEGGTHHLYAVGFLLKRHVANGGAVSGAWSSGREYLDQAIARAKQSQIADGSFSLATFAGWTESDSPSLLVWGTGHMVEWLTQALTTDQLKEPWMAAAVTRLTEEILKLDVTAFSDGGMYHAANALRLYRNAVFPE